MKLIKRITLAALFSFLSANVFAAQIAGTVTNGTTKKPSAGDEVVLLSLAGGMDEVARAKTDAQGHFVLNAPDQGQSLIRVDHQGVNYFKAAPQGTIAVDVTIYDASKSIDRLIGEGRVFRFQTLPDGKLEVNEMFILRNESDPPRTKMGERSFEFDLPAGAEVEDGMAEGPGGMPTNVPPVKAGKKDRYGFAFPIRPGRTRFQVTYKLPYAGTREFKITPDAPLAELGIMLPKSMQFKSGDKDFTPAQDEAGMTVFVAKSVSAGKQLEFLVSGEGTMPNEGQAGGASASQTQDAAPGGGLGAPNQAPDPLGTSRWYIITIFVVVLGGAGYWLFRMQRGMVHVSPGGAGTSLPRAGGKQRDVQPYASAPARSSGNGDGLLEALKDELFQLETDRVSGKLSQQDYERSKAGIETLMRRQLKKVEETRKK